MAKPAASSRRRSSRSFQALVMPNHTTAPAITTTIAVPIAVATATRARSDGVRVRIRDRKFMAARPGYCMRSTNPTPRTVCSSRGPPWASSLRRRYPMKTSTTLVSAAKS